MDVKISALPAATQANSSDLLAKVDAAGPTTQKLTIQQLLNLIGVGSGLIVLNNTNGEGTFAGDITLFNVSTGIILTSPNGFNYRITVEDGGQITTTIV